MLLDRLLDNWKQFLNDYDYGPIRTNGIGESNSWESVRDILKNAVAFDLKNVSYYVSERWQQLKFDPTEIPNVRPPFHTMWLEFTNPFSEKLKLRVKKLDDSYVLPGGSGLDDNKYGMLFDVWKESSDEIRVGTFIFREDVSGEIFFSGGLSWFCDASGKPIEQFDFISKFYLHDDPKMQQETITAVYMLLYVPQLAISFMHCKNIIIHSEEPSAKLQKARERRGKLPLFTFKTLEIKPITKLLKEEGESETKGLQYALHICRGHFKDFSQGKGLFGKNKGLFWWDSQVRGSRQIGAVIKDYKVSPNT